MSVQWRIGVAGAVGTLDGGLGLFRGFSSIEIRKVSR
jgi:hypothetical protein